METIISVFKILKIRQRFLWLSIYGFAWILVVFYVTSRMARSYAEMCYAMPRHIKKVEALAQLLSE